MTSRAIACHDILHEIFLHLAPVRQPENNIWSAVHDRENRRKRATLAACARVNRIVSEHALSFLWRVLDGVEPLLDVLAHSDKNFPGVVDDFSWGRFQRYASLVRELRHYIGALSTLPVSESIAERLDGEPFFPHLRRLEMSADLARTRCGSLLLLSPSIRDLDFGSSIYNSCVSFAEPTGIVNAVLSSISSEVPSPSGVPGALPHVARHLQTIVRLADLCKLRICFGLNLYYPTMQALSTLVNLRELHGCVSFAEMEAHTPCRGGFRALESLYVHGSLADVEEAIQMVSPPRLHTFQLGILDFKRATIRGLRRLLHKVRLAAPGLTSLHLFSTGVFDETLLAPISLVELLQSIFPLRHLEQLIWRLSGHVNFACDRDLAAFAAAWPNLRMLRLPYGPRRLPSQGITFPALLDFLRRCPRVELLHLDCLDVAHLPAAHSIPRMEQSRVRFFFFGNKACEQTTSPADVLILATLVDRLFPNVDIPYSRCEVGRGSLAFQVFEALQDMRATLPASTSTDTR